MRLLAAEDTFGIKRGMMSTILAMTASRPTAGTAITPSSTVLANAAANVVPEV